MNIIDENEVKKEEEIKTIPFWKLLVFNGVLFVSSFILALQLNNHYHWRLTLSAITFNVTTISSFCLILGYFGIYSKKKLFLKYIMYGISIIITLFFFFQYNSRVITFYIAMNLISLLLFYLYLKNKKIKF